MIYDSSLSKLNKQTFKSERARAPPIAKSAFELADVSPNDPYGKNLMFFFFFLKKNKQTFLFFPFLF